MKHNTMYSVVQRAAFVFALLIPAVQTLAQDMLFENQIDGYAQVESYIYPSGTNLEAADDFTVTGTVERVWIYGGNCCLTSCSFPTDIIEVTIRFYADDNGQPGELLAEYVLDGDDPAFVWNEPAGPTLLDVTLPQPFEADGTYFISAQPEFDTFFCWRWWISNHNNPVGSALWTRNNQAGGDWAAYITGLGDELNADLAFAIIGTPGEPDPPPTFVEDDCDSDWLEIDVPDHQPGEAGIPELVEGVSNSLEDVVILSPTEAWAVGSYGYSELGGDGGQSFSLTMFYDGTTWTPVPAPSPTNVLGVSQVDVRSVSAVSSDLIYAAGAYTDEVPSGPDTFVMRWDGTSWQHIVSPGQSGFGSTGFFFEAVEAIDEQNIWFGGQFNSGPGHAKATMVHYDGSSFTTYTLPLDPNVVNGAHRIRAIAPLDTDDIWAAGSAGGVAVAVGASYVAHWDGSSWQHMPTPHPGIGEIAYDVAAIASDDVWICGRYNVIPDGGGPVIPTPLFLHWDGNEWTQFESPAFATDLVVINSNRIYGVNGEQLVYWNGKTWGLVGDLDDDLNNINLRALGAFGDCSYLAVGSTSGTFKDTRAARYQLQSVPGDVDGDLTVGVQDLLILLAAWGPCDGAPCPADLDGDGSVNVSDLLVLLANWS